MKKNIIFVGAIFLSFFLYTHGVWANPKEIIDELATSTSLPSDKVIEIGLIPTTIRFLLSIFSVLLTGVAIYAGYLFVANFGDEEDITKAKKLIIWSIVGVSITAISYAIVSGIINLDFTQTK